MSEDTLTPRNETIPGLVELVTLNVGDEFQAGDTGGTVVWKVNKGSARAVDVLYDGHSKPISIAPSLKVIVRKKVDVLEEFKNRFAANVEAAGLMTIDFEEVVEMSTVTCQDCRQQTDVIDGVLCVECGEQFCCDCINSVPREFDMVYLCNECHKRVAVPEDSIDFSKSPAEVEPPAPEDLPPAPKPIPSPTIRVIRLTADGSKTMTVMVQPPLPTCKFDLTLTPEQIRLLTFDSVKQMFYKGLYFGWTRETFFEVAKAKFPHLKAGQNYESCLAQIRLYHCALKNAGRMQ